MNSFQVPLPGQTIPKIYLKKLDQIKSGEIHKALTIVYIIHAIFT